jgi:hypothetical protein
MAGRELQNGQAVRLLDTVGPEKAFYFYTEVGQPLGRSADSIEVFAELVAEIDASSVKFHLERGDFENWFKMMGDSILPDLLAELRGKDKPATELRSKVSSGVKSRVTQLRKASESKRPQQQPPQRPQGRRSQAGKKTTSLKKPRAPSSSS